MPLVSRLTTLFLKSRSLSRSILRLAELDAPRLRVARLVDQLGDVQQRLRRNAAAIDADAAGIHFGIDEGDAQTEVRAEKRGRVATGPAADHDELSRNHKRAGMARRHEGLTDRTFVSSRLRGPSLR